MFHILIDTILLIFSIILPGYFLKAEGIIDAAFSRSANQIVFNVALPGKKRKNLYTTWGIGRRDG